MEESHKTHRPHIKVGKDEEKKESLSANRAWPVFRSRYNVAIYDLCDSAGIAHIRGSVDRQRPSLPTPHQFQGITKPLCHSGTFQFPSITVFQWYHPYSQQCHPQTGSRLAAGVAANIESCGKRVHNIII